MKLLWFTCCRLSIDDIEWPWWTDTRDTSNVSLLIDNWWTRNRGTPTRQHILKPLIPWYLTALVQELIYIHFPIFRTSEFTIWRFSQTSPHFLLWTILFSLIWIWLQNLGTAIRDIATLEKTLECRNYTIFVFLATCMTAISWWLEISWFDLRRCHRFYFTLDAWTPKT
jgi:hypothetical protein